MPESAYDILLDELEKLPGIGRRSAERIAFHLLRQPSESSVHLASALTRFRTNLKVCDTCGHVTESDPCPICSDPNRDAGTLLVVEQPSDVVAIEQAGAYRGRYHVLMGRLAPMEAIG
ncbi:MAG: toprim domain-containing protein, partial [Phycisphaeraceae bacterium]